MNDSPRPRPARRLALLAVLAIAIAVGIFALLDEPAEVTGERVPKTVEPEVVAPTPRDEVELASAPSAPESVVPAEAESVHTGVDSEPAAAAATLTSNNRSAVSEAHGVARWSDLLAPFDAHDNTHVADARISIVLADGQLVTASLSDPVDPRALVEGNVGVLDAPNHFSRLFLPHQLADVSTAHAVSLQPAATLRFVPTGDATFLPEGAQINVWSHDERDENTAPFADSTSTDFEPYDPALENSADYGDRLLDPALDDRRRARQLRWIVGREWSQPLFDLTRPTKLGTRTYSNAKIEAETKLLELRVAASRTVEIGLEVPEDAIDIWSLSVETTEPTEGTTQRLEGVPTPAVGASATITVHCRTGTSILGRFPDGATQPRALLTRPNADSPFHWSHSFDVDDDLDFSVGALEAGSYRFVSSWLGANDVHESLQLNVELGVGQRVDLGTLAGTSGLQRVTIVPVLRVDGERSAESIPISFEAWLHHDGREGSTEEWSRNIERSNLQNFVCNSLQNTHYNLRLQDVEFDGDAGSRYRWAENRDGVFFEVAGDSTTVELFIDVHSANVCTLAFALPATSASARYWIQGSFVDLEANTSFKVDFDSWIIEGRDEPHTIETAVTAPPGQYTVFVVVTYEDAFGLLESVGPSFAGRTEATVVDGAPSRVEVALLEAVTCVGSLKRITGDAAPTQQINMSPIGMPKDFWSLWFSYPDADAPDDRFAVYGLLPHTEYQINYYGQRFTTGAPGTTTEL